MNHDVQSGFTPYRNPFMNSYGMPSLPVNHMNTPRNTEAQLWDILKQFQGGPHSGIFGNDQQQGDRN